MKSELTERATLVPFFEKLKRGFDESAGEYRIFVEIGEQRVALCFPSHCHAAEVEQCFAGRLISAVPEPDARLRFCSADCSHYIDLSSTSECRRYRDGDRWIIHSPDRWILGADPLRRTFYCCIHDPEKRAQIPYWRVSGLVSQWAGTAGLLPVHGAAVGVDGKGVLLIAAGGGGKSTLAASCLLGGMDYVSDDYVLLSAEGTPLAKPLFSTLKMNPDMRERLGLDLPVITEDASRGGKQLLNASALPICRSLTICAVLFLSRGDWEHPDISKASGHTSVQLAQKALRVDGAYDAHIARDVVKRLSELPAYDMRLGIDPKQNAHTLRAWIERMK